MDNKENVELKTKPATDKAISSKDSAEDRPPTPPKRDFKAEDGSMVKEPQVKRKPTVLFPRPEVIYRPESSKTCMTCLKNSLIILNLLIWLFGAALTGIGIWIKVDKEFWDIQTGLDMKQFSMAGYILIAAGVIIMLIGFVGCYGAFSLSLCLLSVYAIVVILIILMEIAVMALVWTISSNKDMKEEIKAKAKKAMQEMSRNEYQQHFLNLLQSKLHCCGIDGSDDYIIDKDHPITEEGIPHSCTNPDTGYPYEQGCLQSVIEYFKSKAGILGGTAIAVFILQLAALILTCFVACGLKHSAENSIF